MQRVATFALLLWLAAGMGTLLAGDKKKTNPDEIGNRRVDKGINLYSMGREIALGRQLAIEVRRQSKLVEDPILGEYVNRIGQNLVRNSDATIPFSFEVVDAEQINAFALPGGFIFVNSGLLRGTETEAELAGALAHEIAHVAARHITKQATRSELVNYGTLPLILLGGWTGYAVRQGAGLAIPMSFLSFSRGYESEADLLGIQYMYKAGYDPTASIDLFERLLSLQKRRPGTIAKVFSTHPMTEDRLTTTQKNIQEYLPGKPEYVVTTSEFNDMQERLSAMYARRKPEPDSSRPRLRKAPGAVEPGEGDQSEDEKPTLKRRELVGHHGIESNE